jgi:hypothetical protein
MPHIHARILDLYPRFFGETVRGRMARNGTIEEVETILWFVAPVQLLCTILLVGSFTIMAPGTP